MTTRSRSGDLRVRAIAAMKMGFQCGRLAGAFVSGSRRPGAWCRSYRETSEMEARKQGQLSRSKPDVHQAFHTWPDRRRAGYHAFREQRAPATAWLFLDWRGITFKKPAPRGSSAPTPCAVA